MTKWEFAYLSWEGTGRGKHRSVEFSHRAEWDKIPGDALFGTMRLLGDEGFELVNHSNTGGWNGWWFKRALEPSQ